MRRFCRISDSDRGAVAQEEHCLLDRPFTRILSLQLLNFLFVQLRVDSQPGGDDSRQPEGEFPIEVYIHPIWIALLNYKSRNFLH